MNSTCVFQDNLSSTNEFFNKKLKKLAKNPKRTSTTGIIDLKSGEKLDEELYAKEIHKTRRRDVVRIGIYFKSGLINLFVNKDKSTDNKYKSRFIKELIN
jgi:hypothetical protein